MEQYSHDEIHGSLELDGDGFLGQYFTIKEAMRVAEASYAQIFYAIHHEKGPSHLPAVRRGYQWFIHRHDLLPFSMLLLNRHQLRDQRARLQREAEERREQVRKESELALQRIKKEVAGPVLTVAEAAKELGLDPQLVRTYASPSVGRLTAIRLPNRRLVFSSRYISEVKRQRQSA
jgi:hypothetical protein